MRHQNKGQETERHADNDRVNATNVLAETAFPFPITPYLNSSFGFWLTRQQGFLHVIVPADIVAVTGNLAVVEGGTARLVCETKGYPRPKVFWTREERSKPILVWDSNSRAERESKTNVMQATEVVLSSSFGICHTALRNSGASKALGKSSKIKLLVTQG